MAYVLPQVLVFQELNLVAAVSLQPLPSHISGGHASLLRYAEADEKILGALGQYDPDVEQSYDWPERPAGGIVDQSYTRLFIDNAMLRYYHNEIGSGDTILAVGTNVLQAGTTVFKTANGVSRNASFYDRDVRVGDAVRATFNADGADYELCSYVQELIPDYSAGVVGAGAASSTNVATDAAATSVTKTAGPDNCVDINPTIAESFVGNAVGLTEETYTIRVIEGSVGGDLTTAKLLVTSASGLDDAGVISPSAADVDTPIGSLGLNVQFTVDSGNCSVSASIDDVAPDDLAVGQEWEVTIAQDFTATTIATGGAYAGTVDDTYIIEVTKGGVGSTSANRGQITVRTAKGTDASGPHDVTGSAVAIGTKGVTVTLAASVMLGDTFTIAATAPAAQSVKKLRLAHAFPADVVTYLAANPGDVEVELELFIEKNIEVEANRTGFAPLTNWTQSATQITVDTGVVAYDESWTDGGTPLPLPVIDACSKSQMYVEARYWLSTLAGDVHSLSDVAGLNAAISGPLHPDNPLKWGVFKALQNSNGASVQFTAVCDPDDTDEWTSVLELIEGRRDVYGLVPLTRNATVWSLFQAHVNGQSGAESGNWRVVWLNPDAVEEKAIIDATSTTDEEVAIAVLEDDPNTTGTQYTQLRVTSGNVGFVTRGVQAGDIVRYKFTTDGFGETTYTELIVDAVVNETTLRLQTGLGAAVAVAEKVEVWRNLSAGAIADDLALTGGFSDRRVRYVWPDEIESDGYTTPGYFLCAALAGLCSGVVPHQGLTNLEIAGFSSVPRTTLTFSRSQLNTMAEGGVWIVTQDPQTGDIYTRHAVTTADYEVIAEREEMITRNLDSISFLFLDTYAPYIGVSNVTSSALEALRAETRARIAFLEGANYVERLGAQLIAGELVELRPHVTLKDRVVVVLNLTLPYPLNNLECHLVLVA